MRTADHQGDEDQAVSNAPDSVPARDPDRRQSGLAPEHLYKAVGLAFLLLLVYRYFPEISRVFLLMYAAAVVGVAMNVIVGLIPSRRRMMSVALGITIVSAFVASLWIVVPILTDQLRGLTTDIPRFQRELMLLGDWLRSRTGLNIDVVTQRSSELLQEIVAGPEVLGRAWGVLEGIFLPILIGLGGLYAVANPNRQLLSPLIQVFPRNRRDDFRRLASLLGHRLVGWVKGTLMAMFAVGLLATVGLWIIGVKYAFLLGVIAGVLEIVPIVGPWVSGGIAVAVALLDDPGKALWVTALMIAVQQLENGLITPLAMSSAAKVHPFVTLFALILSGSLFGFLGIVLAVPLVLLGWTVIEVLWVERAIGAEADQIEPLVRE